MSIPQLSLALGPEKPPPLVVSFGAGVDSTAMLVELHRRGLSPDLIIFADTGSEMPESYAYLDVIDVWLGQVGFPSLTVVKNARPKSGDQSLGDALLRNSVLPALAYGQHQCSLVWKVSVIQKHVRKVFAWSGRSRTWGDGVPHVTMAIGYDAGPRDRTRAGKAHGKDSAGIVNWYPLIEWGLDRAGCVEAIVRAGLPVPRKSSCWFCPAMRREEVDGLALSHPALLAQAILIEDRARARGLTSVRGLGRSWSWREYLTETAPPAIRAIAAKVLG
jgi:hypothetical protein